MRLLVASLAIALGMSSSAMAERAPCSSSADRGTNEFHRYKSTEVTIIVHKGRFPDVAYPHGYVQLDAPTSLSCHSSKGCLLIVDAMVQNYQGAAICSILDGKYLFPRPIPDSGQVGMLQSGTMSAGKHSVQTVIYLPSPNTELNGWQVDYTLYDGE